MTSPATRAARGGLPPPPPGGGAPLIADPALAAVWAYSDLDALDGAMGGGRDGYRRYGNQSVELLETALAGLETPDGGEAPLCRVTASGQAALLLALTLTVTSKRRRVVVVRPCYGATETLVAGPMANLGVELTSVDMRAGEVGLDAVEAALGDDVALCVAEVITNPLMGLLDVPALCALCRERGVTSLIDSTFATPVLLRPFEHGADLVMHSLSKSISGHSDVLGGALLVAPEHPAADWLDAHSRLCGAVLGPFDAWLTLRGLRTAGLRVAASSANAARLADHCAGAPGVVAVHYPGSHSDAEEALAERLLPSGRGAMLGIDLGSRESAEAFLAAVPGIRLAPSLGDVATTASHPALSSHRGWSPQQRAALGIGDGLVRLSVGCEDAADLLPEVDAGLRATMSENRRNPRP